MAQTKRPSEVVSRNITASNIAFTEHAPHQPFSGRVQHVLLLHGWMGTAGDLFSIAHSLAEQGGYTVLTPDLPLHGDSIGSSPQSMTEAADMIFRALQTIIPNRKRHHPIAIAGYSLGGRLAFEMATLAAGREQCLFQVNALILISAAPSPRADVEMERELCASYAIRRSEELRDLDARKKAFQRWLQRSWYAASMWGSISKAPGFQNMINSKVSAFDETQRDAWCEAAICMSRATMTEPSEKLEIPTLYVCGVHDSKYLLWSSEMKWFLRDFLCVQVHDAGHNVILQQPEVVESCITEFLEQTYRDSTTNEFVDVYSIKILQYSLPLTREITVNGEDLSQRDGVLVALVSRNGSFGVGDICPLPGWHKESISACIEELSHFASRVEEDQLCLSFSTVVEANSLFHEYSPATRGGLEAAYLHLMSRSKGFQLTDCMSRLASIREPRLESPASVISLNGVLPRMSNSGQPLANETQNIYHQFVAESAFDTLKLKVGASDDLHKDGLMAREAISAAAHLGKKVRLDANRAWTTEKFNTFLSAMKDRVSDVEFIEEPLRSANELETYLAAATDTYAGISVALDESLAAGPSEQVQRMASSNACKALVLKPFVIGSFRQVVDLTTLALDKGCDVILSTCFESGVGTAWTAILASVLGHGSSKHGLGTYVYMKEDILDMSFGRSCVVEDGSRVLISKCETFLELAGQHVLDKGATPKFTRGSRATSL